MMIKIARPALKTRVVRVCGNTPIISLIATCTYAAFEILKDSRCSLVLSRDECSNLTDNALTKKRRPWRFTPRLTPLVQRVTYKRYTSMQRRLIRACTNVQSHQSLSPQGGGGGYSIFFRIRRLRSSIYRSPPPPKKKKYQEFQAPPKNI